MKRTFTLLLVTMGLFGCFKKRSSEEKFWDWFTVYSQKIAVVESLSDARLGKLLDPLSKHLNDYCAGLIFEIGYEPETKVFELVISADGDKRLFPQVEHLVDAAPDVDRWKVTALRQPKGAPYTIEYEGYKFNSDQIFFIPLKDKEHPLPIDIEVVYPDYEDIIRKTE